MGIETKPNKQSGAGKFILIQKVQRADPKDQSQS